ncbi:hypothetical protein [Streptomyces sp. NPDC057682]|uniref:hypothetical protein n=1 Tax=Streptomyces sp. NPDC057682 TaxID=3346210 RepID=UPI003681DA05
MHDYPEDLRAAQVALHRTHADFDEYATTLPWSADPMPGWETEKQPYSSFRSGKPDSPGYTDEQRATVDQFRAELLRLSEAVATHPYWATLDRGDVVSARMALKHAHEQPEA